MPPRIKFCGITRLEDAELAVALDAWAVGLIFYPGSPRRADPGTAATIARALKRRAEVAGVFVDPPLDDVIELADAIGFTLIQLHGHEGPAFCAEVARRTGAKVIKAARVRTKADVLGLRAFPTDFHLLDSFVPGHYGGTGETFAWDLVREHRGGVPVVLSGGLTPENVAEGVAATEPYAVDVASGVEAEPGIKDHARMEAFAAAVRTAVVPAA